MCIWKLITSHWKELLKHLVSLELYCYNKSSVHLNSVCYASLSYFTTQYPKHKHFPSRYKKSWALFPIRDKCFLREQILNSKPKFKVLSKVECMYKSFGDVAKKKILIQQLWSWADTLHFSREITLLDDVEALVHTDYTPAALGPGALVAPGNCTSLRATNSILLSSLLKLMTPEIYIKFSLTIHSFTFSFFCCSWKSDLSSLLLSLS